MASPGIGPVQLNIDPNRYAGSIVRRLNVPSLAGGGLGGGPGGGIYNLLNEQAKIRNQLAKAQLDALRQDMRLRRRQDERAGARGAEAFLESSNRERRERQAQQDFLRKQAFLERQQGRGERGKAGMLARSLLEGPGAYRAPGDVQALQDTIAAIGIPRAHAGLMQSGALLASQAGTPSLSSQQRADLTRAMNLGLPPQTRVSGTTQTPETYHLRRGTNLPGRYRGRPVGSRHRGSPITTSPQSGLTPTQYTIRRKGTIPGTLPQNEKAQLHEGEVVLSADQVDEPLMAALIADKQMKLQTGQMDGKGTGPGAHHRHKAAHLPPSESFADRRVYRKGSLPSYQAGSASDIRPEDLAPEYASASHLPGFELADILKPGFEPILELPRAMRREREEKGLGSFLLSRSPLGYLTEPLMEGARSFVQGRIPSPNVRGVGMFGDAVGGIQEAIGGTGRPEAAHAAGGVDDLPPEATALSEPEAEPEPSLFDRMLSAAEESGAPRKSRFDVTSKEFQDKETAAMNERTLRDKAQRMQQFAMQGLIDGTLSKDMQSYFVENIKSYNQMADMAQKMREKIEDTETAREQAGADRVQRAYETGIKAEVEGGEQLARYHRNRRKSESDYQDKITRYRRTVEADPTELQESLALGDVINAYREKEAFNDRLISSREAEIEVMLDLGLIDMDEAARLFSELAGGG